MYRTIFPFVICLSLYLLSGCMGVRQMAIEIKEKPRLQLPANIKKVLVVNNSVQQPANIGHKQQDADATTDATASSDSIAYIFTDAFAQFLSEEGYFEDVIFYDKPLRIDTNFNEEMAILPEDMNRMRKEANADAIISLDKLFIKTDRTNLFKQSGYTYATLTANINSVFRVYLPSAAGEIPEVNYSKDSLQWEGFYSPDNNLVEADLVLPTREQAMKALVIYGAEKMSAVFVPHWKKQSRWIYNISSSKGKEAESFAENKEWNKAIDSWRAFFKSANKIDEKAKAASNIAFAYEMSDNIDKALEWIKKSEELFKEAKSNNQFILERVGLYKKELELRNDKSRGIKM